MRKIIDAGHGDHDSGAVSIDGKHLEKNIALAVSLRVFELLKPYGFVTATRHDDSFVTLSGRASMANSRDCDLLSIHCNAGGGHGIEVFTSPGQTRSDPWATEVLEAMHRRVPDQPLRTDIRDGDPDKEARFTVLTRTRKSAILVELGFMDSKEGIKFLTDPANQEKLSLGIAEGTLIHEGIAPVSEVFFPHTELSAPSTVVDLTSAQKLERLWDLHPELHY